jgi:glycosyltransferase involved in cell wall biosynthesis
VLVLSVRAPFVHGGAEELRDHLVRNLNLTPGVRAASMSLPFSWDPWTRLLDEMLIARGLRIAGVDRVIPIKFPAYLVEHHGRTPWLAHQFRQVYDMWDNGTSNIPDTPEGRRVRDLIRAVDRDALSGLRRLFAVSQAARRLRHYCRIEAETLSAPLNDPWLFTGGEAGGYVLAGGRVGGAKRQDLLVRALRHAPGVRLVVAGRPDVPEEGVRLRRLAEAEGVADRVRFELRFLPREELAALVNAASAVAYIPLDEDSAGYVTMEAFQGAKPVVTTSDSGGVLELVRDGETGWVAEPEPEALGAALAQAVADPARAALRGRAGRVALDALGLTWPRTVARLLS